MKLIADKQLRSANYLADIGDEFEVEAEEAAQLIEAKAAHPAPKGVERATVDEPKVEKAVDAPEQRRVIPTKPVNPKPKPKKKAAKKKGPSRK